MRFLQKQMFINCKYGLLLLPGIKPFMGFRQRATPGSTKLIRFTPPLNRN